MVIEKWSSEGVNFRNATRRGTNLEHFNGHIRAAKPEQKIEVGDVVFINNHPHAVCEITKNATTTFFKDQNGVIFHRFTRQNKQIKYADLPVIQG